ncbi:MAG: hypothetical protein WDM90_22455 [Ferruginibacter sp.]
MGFTVVQTVFVQPYTLFVKDKTDGEDWSDITYRKIGAKTCSGKKRWRSKRRCLVSKQSHCALAYQQRG